MPYRSLAFRGPARRDLAVRTCFQASDWRKVQALGICHRRGQTVERGDKMDGLQTVAATDVAITIGGGNYRLARLRLVDYAEIERHLLASRPDPLALVLANLAKLEEPLQRHLLERAYDDARRGPRVAREDLLDWFDTHAGKVFRVWLSLRRYEPDLTLPDAERLLSRATLEEELQLRWALEEVAGDPRGN